jgi:hypothetical protein
MSLFRALVATLIVVVAILGPTLFMASAPCFDCDGVCGTSATFASTEVRTVVFVLPLPSPSVTQVPPTPVLLSELPPRPLLATV